MLSPIQINNNRKIGKNPVVTRPITESGMKQFEQFFCSHTWEEVLTEPNIDLKVANFHQTITSKLDEIFPQKIVMVSYLDKK